MATITEARPQILKLKTVVTREFKTQVAAHPDVILWLGKVGYKTRPGYLTNLCYYLKCVGIEDPGALLDLKGTEDPKRRYFPAERLAETWHALARASLSDAQIKKVLDAVRSFYKRNRVQLIDVQCSYKPRARGEISDEQLRTFRESFNWVGKILFDFLLSVPVRDGQFQRCKNCGQEFFPRWRDIKTYPKIEAYSPFTIKPEKGHESDQYPEGLMQVCFLTESAARSLNLYREIKQRALGRDLNPEEFIFTHQKSHLGTKHLAPITQPTVESFFQGAAERSHQEISPHTLRAWVNSVLMTRGIEKTLRDLYLGHTCSYEMGYIMQLIPKWQQTFREAKAMEHLDLQGSMLSQSELESKLLRLEEQEEEIRKLRSELHEVVNEEDLKAFRQFSRLIQEGKVKIVKA